MTLQEAIEEVKRHYDKFGQVWSYTGVNLYKRRDTAIATILNAVVKGELKE
jgi:hypothetical protein